jgi:hypothetical protein
MGNITTAMVKQFGANVDILSQQKGSKLRGAVRVETGIVGEEAYIDQLASTTAQKKTTRNADTPLIKSDHRRRRLTMYDYEWADLLDKQDKLKILSDPTNKYAMNAAYAMGRAMDSAIIAAATGTAYTGKAGGTSTAMTTANVIASSSTVMTLAKLRQAKYLLDAADVDPDEERYIAVGARQVYDLLGDTTLTSADYNTVKGLVEGRVDTFLGFKFIMVNLLDLETGGTNGDRTCIAWAKNGLCLGIAQDVQTDIGPRRDKSNAVQVYQCMGIGSTRTEEAKVVSIACEE